MKSTHLFLDVFVVVVDTLALIHLSGLRCNDVTHVDLGTRSGCHSNIPEIKAVFFSLFHVFTYYLTRFGRFARFSGFVLVVSFHSFRWFHFGCFVSLFRVLVHADTVLSSLTH